MRLLPIETPELVSLASRWLAEPENYQWLDFGDGRQIVTPALLKIMLQRSTHFMRIYTNMEGLPVGIVALNSVDRRSGTGTFWGVAGDKTFRSRGYGAMASDLFLALAFGELGLHSINTWAVEHNPSRKIIERLGFRLIGKLRQCHRMNGELYDRVLYDLLASEYGQRSKPVVGAGEAIQQRAGDDDGISPAARSARSRRTVATPASPATYSSQNSASVTPRDHIATSSKSLSRYS